MPALVADADLSTTPPVEGDDIRPLVTDEFFLGERVFYWRTQQQLSVRKGDWKLVRNGG